MPEAIRLIIWDLDETYWQGTLTEGGHRYNRATHDIVLTLARRGIMSSICSKNDLAPVRDILQAEGIWDSFIFPSINWEPKGPRIAALIEAVQLRPETILFIDDNPMNRQEALHFCPGLQVADETIIPTLLDNKLLRGKDDSGLTRLAQYKLLERRKADEQAAAAKSGGSNVDFLRASNIRVRIERDVLRHIDRAVELINRTNQLNFTKIRLSEQPEEARAELTELLGSHVVQAGLIEVFDDYGNYGYCGIYVSRMGGGIPKLVHFCFSCRILNMGVEAWLFQKLGKPIMRQRGAVLSDPAKAAPVDWITEVTTSDDAPAGLPAHLRSSVAARGGCVLMPLVHYFTGIASHVTGEYNTVRDGLTIRLDHSLCFRHAIEGLSPEAFAAIEPLGFVASDFETRFFDCDGAAPLFIFSNWTDLGLGIYRHAKTGLRIPYKPPANPKKRGPNVLRAEEHLAAEFTLEGRMSEEEMRENLRFVLSRVPAHGRVFVPMAYDQFEEDGVMKPNRPRRRQNALIEEVAAEFPNVTPLLMNDFVLKPDEIREPRTAGHFDRMVYFRLYQEIARRTGLAEAAKEAA